MPAPTHLLIIDPQNDFCDLPDDWCPLDPATGRRLAPALPVTGAHGDMRRLAAFVQRQGEAIDAITVTLDSHHVWDVAHPAFWRRGTASAAPGAVDTDAAQAVSPFTEITAAQVRAGDYTPRQAQAVPRVLAYLDALEATGRYRLMVWPTHCVIGSWGQAVHAALQAALGEWEARRGRPVEVVWKGRNPWTEHYSAVRAEVPDPDDSETGLNHALLARLDGARRLLVAGEAGSHCVRATVEHLIDHLPGGRPERLTLLADAISPVGGFEAAQEAFYAAARQAGCRIATLDQALSLAPHCASNC